MPKNLAEDDGRRPRNGVIIVVVGLGIAFFISGFVLTVTSLSEPDTVAADDGRFSSSDPGAPDSSLSLLFGLLLSLAGVVLATAGPAMFFIHSSRHPE